MRAFLLFAAAVFFLSFATASRGDDASALVNEALDKVVTIEVDGMMPDVMKKITDDTGVAIEVPQHVYDLLPWGQKTNIKATIKNQTLGQALTAITRRLGLNWELQPHGIRLLPRLPLDRISRRAKQSELQTLDLLDSTPFDEAPPDGKAATVDWVIKAVDQRLASVKSNVTIEYRPGIPPAVKPDQTINLLRNGTLNDALKELVKQTDLTWYPSAEHIVVLTKKDQILRQLDRTLTMNFNGVELTQVLAELSQTAGVEFEYEAGALQRVPPEFKRISLVLENASVRQALHDISGVTGLAIEVKSTGVCLSNQNPPSAAPAAAPSPIVATLQLDNGMTLFLRANEVPADILEYAEHKKLQEFKRLRQQMTDERFVPSTQPAPRPQ